ncbi:MAG: S-methyl-5'-thioinosine phosphorylase [Gammaproteobacteria bacterium]|nr:S-methyl-5'-thioinosine phosphorylase [Gammaproteobacteria bacterium]
MSWAVIGGSGALPLVEDFRPLQPPVSAYRNTRPGALSAGRLGGREVIFLPRHGTPHQTAPHLINYRANVDTLRLLGVHGIVALNTVGGISAAAESGRLVVPDQIIDYTWGRAHTFSDGNALIHCDFARPFDEPLRQGLVSAAAAIGVPVTEGGVYGATQGPRFETAAEIVRMRRDGCDLVGMTGMPEAALAREVELPYAMLSLVVNPAAGCADDPFDMVVIRQVAEAGMQRVARLLVEFFENQVGG